MSKIEVLIKIFTYQGLQSKKFQNPYTALALNLQGPVGLFATGLFKRD